MPLPAFSTLHLRDARSETAPDGSAVEVLLRLDGGSLARFTLGPGCTSTAVVHRSVEEIWYVLSGHGEMWRCDGGGEQITRLEAGTCLTVPRGTRFQFRAASGEEPLVAVAVTMPPWPGPDEAARVEGPWTPDPA